MNEVKKPYKEPETEIEILNAKLRISDWYVRKITELNEKLDKLRELEAAAAKGVKAS